MANRYVYNNGGTASGDDWTFSGNDATTGVNVYSSLVAVDGVVTAGDTVFVASDHAIDYGSSTTHITFANPCHVVTVNRSTGAFEAHTASYGESVLTGYWITISLPSQSEMYFEGIRLASATGQVNPAYTNSGGRAVFRKCSFKTSGVLAANSENDRVYFDQCTFDRDSSSTQPCFNDGTAETIIDNCTFLNSGSLPSWFEFAAITNAGGRYEFRNCDLSAAANLVRTNESSNASWGQVRFFRCKLATSYAVLASTHDLGPNQTVILDECFTGTAAIPSTVYAESRTYTAQHGSSSAISFDTATQRSGSDGTTDYSVKVVTNANCSRYGFCEVPKQFAIWHPGTGEHTLTIHLASSDSGLDDGQLYAKIESPSEESPATAISRPINTRQDYGANAPAGTSAYLKAVDETSEWTGSPGTTYQIVADDLNPTVAGWVYVRLYVAKASTTVWIDPAFDLTAN